MISHEKIISLPIGLANRYWTHGDISIISQKTKTIKNFMNRKHLFYLNVSSSTHFERNFLINRMKLNFHSEKNFNEKEKFYICSERKSWSEYLDDISNSIFVLSPRGNGSDCHRTWETLYLGAIPVVVDNGKENINLYDDLPIVKLKNWEEWNINTLNKHLIEFLQQEKNFNKEKIWFSYWKDLISDI